MRGRSVVDREEYDQLFGVEGGEVECFVDRHEEREWLVVSCSFSFLFFSFLFFPYPFFFGGRREERGERERPMELGWSGVTNENLALLFL